MIETRMVEAAAQVVAASVRRLDAHVAGVTCRAAFDQLGLRRLAGAGTSDGPRGTPAPTLMSLNLLSINARRFHDHGRRSPEVKGPCRFSPV